MASAESLDSRQSRDAALDSTALADLEAIVHTQFRVSTWAARALMLLQIAAIPIVAVESVRRAIGSALPWAIVTIGLLAPALRIMSDRARGRADRALTMREFHVGSGDPPATPEIASLIRQSGWIGRTLLRLSSTDRRSFSHPHAEHDARRLMLNTVESAWWSARLAKGMAVICLAGSIGLGAAALIGLFPHLALTSDYLEFAAGLIVFVFAEWAVGKRSGHLDFAAASESIVRRGLNRLRSQSADDLSALRLTLEYQKARLVAPTLSTVWWKINRKRLNAEWDRIAQDLDPRAE
jgi:hypothetical protein